MERRLKRTLLVIGYGPVGTGRRETLDAGAILLPVDHKAPPGKAWFMSLAGLVCLWLDDVEEKRTNKKH